MNQRANVKEPKPSSAVHMASAALLLATLFWGCGFTWAKAGGEAVNRLSGAGEGSRVGPTLLLAWRFVGGGILCLIVFPRARRGWIWKDAVAALAVGLLLGFGVTLQHLGLNLTSEAVSAFLTNLTILFVPLFVTIGLRRPPSMATWIGVVLATAGIWLMTGGSPTGFGWGEVLGIGCSIAFSFYIIAVNAFVSPRNVWRVMAGQFIIAGLVAACVTLTDAHGRAAMTPGAQWMILADADVWWRAALLTILTTVFAFGLMNYFQPRLEPTHAALIYLLEPVIASGFAMFFAGRRLSAIAWAGAGLILVANLIVEIISPRRDKNES